MERAVQPIAIHTENSVALWVHQPRRNFALVNTTAWATCCTGQFRETDLKFLDKAINFIG